MQIKYNIYNIFLIKIITYILYTNLNTFKHFAVSYELRRVRLRLKISMQDYKKINHYIYCYSQKKLNYAKS